MPILLEEDLKVELPKMINIRQKFADTYIADVHEAVQAELMQHKLSGIIKPGMSVAITAGSRGINQIDVIIKTVVDFVKNQGAQPFIVPAMGSHGGATAQGQLEVLQNYNITPASMGVEIRSSMEVDVLGETPSGIPVYIDRNAHKADLIIPINRVKPHTGFRGPIESGVCKMMAIGLGKHVGCSRIHQMERSVFSKTITEVAEVFLSKANFGFGIGIVENTYDKPMIIKAMCKEELIIEEQKLLVIAKQMMPNLLLPKVDILVVEQIGKNISGAGMDPNIIGRHTALKEVEGYTGPNIERIVVLGLSEETHGNATGLGNADFITRQVYDSIDFVATYANVIAARNPGGAKIPIVMDNEHEAMLAAVKCCRGIGTDGPYIVRIKDTLHLGEIAVSANMLPIVQASDSLELL